MAKIDTTKIEGYADMTAEQKLAALEAFELPDNNSAELERLKNAVSKANSEAAEYKKQLRAKQTDAEIKAAEDEKARTEMEKELEGLPCAGYGTGLEAAVSAIICETVHIGLKNLNGICANKVHTCCRNVENGGQRFALINLIK